MTTSVVNKPDDNRFELQIDGEIAGRIEYLVSDGAIHLVHTEVDKGRREHGLGGILVEGALDQIRSDTDYRLVADCPFVADWLTHNDGYADLTER